MDLPNQSLVTKFQSLAEQLPAGVPPPPEFPKRLPLRQVISTLLMELTLSKISGETLLKVCEQALVDPGVMEPQHVCAVEPEGGGTVLWALCAGMDGSTNGMKREQKLAAAPTFEALLQASRGLQPQSLWITRTAAVS